MRLIDADRLNSNLAELYHKAVTMRDTEMKKYLSVAAGLIEQQPTIDVNLINEKYQNLPEEQKKAIDMLLDCLTKENERRKKQC